MKSFIKRKVSLQQVKEQARHVGVLEKKGKTNSAWQSRLCILSWNKELTYFKVLKSFCHSVTLLSLCRVNPTKELFRWKDLKLKSSPNLKSHSVLGQYLSIIKEEYGHFQHLPTKKEALGLKVGLCFICTPSMFSTSIMHGHHQRTFFLSSEHH